MSERHEGRRDIALTTLIDLLVQVIFVFTLLLLASDAIQGPPKGGYIPPEAWKTLISIFDVDPKRSHLGQAKEAVEQFNKLREERNKAKQETEALRTNVKALNERIAELDREIAKWRAKAQGGAPGLPPCRNSDGKEITVLRAEINNAGQIAGVLLPEASEIEEIANLTAPYSGKFMSRDEFGKAFDAWRTDALSLQGQKCRYSATVQYDPTATAGDYQPAFKKINDIFRVYPQNVHIRN